MGHHRHHHKHHHESSEKIEEPRAGIISTIFGGLASGISSLFRQVDNHANRLASERISREREEARLANIRREAMEREIGRKEASAAIANRNELLRRREEERKRRAAFLNNPLGVKRYKPGLKI